jgi:O-antigen/teichoic acid export membrane protein
MTALALQNFLSNAWALTHRWKGRIFFAFADQGLYSATNFLLTILYASWLPLDSFGRYVLVWTVSLFVEAVETSLIIDSLPAIVSRYGRRNRHRIDVSAFWIVVIFSVVTSALLAGAALFLVAPLPNYVAPLLVLAAVNPLQRLYLFFRRLCYIRDRQDVAAAAAFAYGLTLLAGASVLMHFEILSVPMVVLLWGFGSLAAILVAVLTGAGRVQRTSMANVAWLGSQLWHSGRWLVAAATAFWISNWGLFPLVAAISGSGAAGVVRALQNLLTPIVQFNAALNLIILPRVADKVADVGDHYGRSFVLRATAVFTIIVLAYCAVILLAAHWILPAIYRKPEISAAAYLLWPLVIATVLESARLASSMALLATRRTRLIFIARFIATISFFAAGIALSYRMGFEGMLWANAFAAGVGALVVLGAAMAVKSKT